MAIAAMVTTTETLLTSLEYAPSDMVPFFRLERAVATTPINATSSNMGISMGANTLPAPAVVRQGCACGLTPTTAPRTAPTPTRMLAAIRAPGVMIVASATIHARANPKAPPRMHHSR
jgi:hypothetical protein